MYGRGNQMYEFEALEPRVLLSADLIIPLDAPASALAPAQNSPLEMPFMGPAENSSLPLSAASTEQIFDLTFENAHPFSPTASDSQTNLPAPPEASPLGNHLLSPGHSPGTMNLAVPEIWSGAEEYLWEINDVNGTEGVDPGWDAIHVTGGLTINATPLNPFNLRIRSLTLANAAGDAANFNNGNAYSWRILSTTTGITGFDRDAINLSTADFSNALGTGRFVLDLADNSRDLLLRFIPTVPFVDFNFPNWEDQGPNGISGNRNLAVPPDNPTIGAIHAVAVQPGNPNVVFVGSVNGGLWRTNDASVASPVWTPLTNHLESIAISALAISPFDNAGAAVTNATAVDHLVVYAGTGNTSNGFTGGRAAGIYRSTDGGTTWTRMDAAGEFNNLPISTIVPSRTTNNFVVLGTGNPTNAPLSANRGGFFWWNGGPNWTRLSNVPRPISDIVADLSAPNEFYVAVSGNLDSNGNRRNDDQIPWEHKGIYRLTWDGASWSVNNITNIRLGIDFNRFDDDHDGGRDPTGDLFETIKFSQRIRLGVTPAAPNVLYAAVADANQRLVAVWRSANSGNTWTPVGQAPFTNSGGQAANNLSLVVDPTDANIVYVGGDAPPNIFRGDFRTAGLITLTTASADANFGAATDLPLIPYNVADSTPRLIMTPTGDDNSVEEGGATDTYQLVLQAAPTVDVRVVFQVGGFSGNFLNSQYQVTVEDNANAGRNFIVFTPANWNVPQLVQVTAVDDGIDETRIHFGFVLHRIESADLRFNNLNAPIATVRILDNDATLPGLTVDQTDGFTLVAESNPGDNHPDTYTVRLDTQPLTDVRVGLIGIHADSVALLANLQAVDDASPANHFLTFTPANWNVPQTVRVLATRDGISEANPYGGRIYHSLTPAGPAEADYVNAAAMPGRVVAVSIIDFNTEGLTVFSPDSNNEVVEGHGTDDLWIILNRAPTANVQVNLAANAQITAVDDANPANNFLTFTAADWWRPQKIRVTAVADAAEQDTWTPVVSTGASGTQPHPDSRQMIFDRSTAAGSILEVSDGGIWRLVNPRSSDNTIRWSSLNGNLAITEFGASIAWDSFNDTIFGGTQDNSVIAQNSPGSTAWTGITWGDGNYVAADGTGTRYLMSNNFEVFFRRTYDAAAHETNPVLVRISNVVNNGAGRVRITSTAHGLNNGDWVQVSDVAGIPGLASSKIVQVTRIDANTFDIADIPFSGAYVTGGLWRRFFPITGAAPFGGGLEIELTSAGHGLAAAEKVIVVDENGLSVLGDAPFFVNVTGANTFVLNGSEDHPLRTPQLKFWSRDDRVMLATSVANTRLSRLAGIDLRDGTGRVFPNIPIAVNAVDPDRLIFGLDDLYESMGADHGDVIDDLTTLMPGPVPTSRITALAYGGRQAGVDAPNVIYEARWNQMRVRSEAGNWTTFVVAGAVRIRDIILDPNDWSRAMAVDQAHVWFTTDAGQHWTNITQNLAGLSREFRSVEFLSDANHGVLIVGVLGGVFKAEIQNLTQLTVAGGERPVWTRFGAGIPNVLVTDLDYSTVDDVLVAGTMGRGVWKLSSARTAAFASQTVRVDTDDTANTVRLRLEPANPNALPTLDIIVDGTTVRSLPVSAIRRIVIHTGGGDDRLIVDASNGQIVVPDGIQFEGDAGGADVLEFAGHTVGATVTHNAAGTLHRLGRERVRTNHVEAPVENHAGAVAVAGAVGDGLLALGDASLTLTDESGLGDSIPVFGTSLGSGLSGANFSTISGEADETETAEDQGDSGISNFFNEGVTGILRRLFETGDGALSLEQLINSSMTATELRDALDALDPILGNVTYDPGTQTYTVQIRKTLGGNAALDSELLGGLITLQGNLDFSADVQLDTQFGVDTNGFFLKAHSGPTVSRLTISNLHVQGLVNATGHFGFLGVELHGATLSVDSAVQFQVEFVEGQPDDITGVPDGKIRVFELLDSPAAFFHVTPPTGDPTRDDVTLTGDFTISAIGLDGEPLFDFGTINLALVWPDIAQPLKVKLDAPSGGPAAILLDFLNWSPQEMLGELRRLLTTLGNFENTDLLNVEVPFTGGKKVGELIDFSQAFLNRVFADLIDVRLTASTGNGSPSANLLLGRLTSSADFSLVIDGGAPVTVTLSSALTSANNSLQDLVDDLNTQISAAFTAAGQTVKVRAALGNGQVTLQLVEGSELEIQGDAASAIFTQLGFSRNSTGISIPKFPTLQELLAKLEDLLDPDGPGPITFDLRPNYDSATKTLTFAFALGYSYSTSTDFSVDSGLVLGDLAEVSAHGTLGMSIDLGLSFTLGIDFNAAKTPQLLGSTVVPPPSNGRLSANSTFVINLNDGQRFTVNLSQGTTSTFTTLSQLIAYMNTQLTGTFNTGTGTLPLNQVIRFAQATTTDSSGATVPSAGIRLEAINEDLDADNHSDVNEDANHNNRLDAGEDLDNDGRLDVLEDTDADGLETMLNIVNSISIEAAQTDPVITEIGFTDGSVARSTIKGVFLQDAAFHGKLKVTGTGLGADARFAIFSISLSGHAEGEVDVALTLTNPHSTGPSDATRIDLGLLASHLSDFSNYVGVGAQVAGHLDIHLALDDIQPAIVGMLIPVGSEVRIFVPDIKNLTYNPAPYDASTNAAGLFVTYPDLGALFNFHCVGWTELVIALKSLSDELGEFKAFSFLNDPLPLINMSISQVIDYAANLATTIQGLASGDGDTLDQLETQIQDLLGIPDDNLDFSVEHTTLETVTAGSATTAAVYRFNPTGKDNALSFTSPANGSAYNGVKIQFVDDGTLTSGADLATVDDYDATHKTVTIHYNATYTRASTIRDAVHAKHLANATTMPFDAALDTADASNAGTGTVHETALKMDLSYHLSYANSLPFQFSLEDLINLLPSDSPARDLLAGVASLISVEGSGNLNVTASADLRLVFGLDVSSPCGVQPFFYDSDYNGPNTGTGITLAAAIHGTNLNFTAGVGAINISVKNGTATLDSDGLPDSAGGDQDASFAVGLKDNNGDGRHYVRSGETFFDSNNIGITLTAGASAVLPLYALGGSIPLGSSSDANGDGYPDNDLVVIIPSLKRLVLPETTDSANHATIVSPGPNNDLLFTGPAAGHEVKIIDTTAAPSAGLNGTRLEVQVNSLRTTATQVLGLTLPAGWSVALSSTDAGNTGAGKVYADLTIVTPDISSLLSSFNACDLIRNAPLLLDGLDALLGTIQDALSNEVFNRNLPLVGDKLNDAANFISDFRTGLLAQIRSKLAEAGDPIQLVKEAIFNSLGKPGLDLIVKSDLSPINSADDVEIDCTGDTVNFKIRLKKSVALVDTSDNPIHLDLGIPELGLSVDGNVKIELGFDLKLYFGISASNGFFFDTSDPEELRIDFRVTIPGLHARGNLFFLQLDVGDESDGVDAMGNPRSSSSFSGFFSVNVRGPSSHPSRLTFADFTGSGFSLGDAFDAQLGATAGVHLDLAVSFDGNAAFPRLLAEFDLTWSWTLGGDDDGTLEFGFHNVQIDLGSFISEFIQPVLSEVKKVTEPFQPLVDIVTTPIPVISDLAGEPITMLKLAELFGYLDPGTVDFINSIAEIITLINDTSFSPSGSILVPIGSFNMQRDALGHVGRAAGDPNPAPATLSSETNDTGTKNFLQKLEDLGFKFPFLSISELFKLFQGEPVTIIEYHMPVLNFSFSYEQSIPIYPPLYVLFGGEVGATIDLTFGYDTYGLQKFFSSSEKNIADIFDGFFVKDVNDQGEDVPEITLHGGLFAGAELNVGIAEAGVTGGLFVDIGFDLNDPDHDGKVRVSEIIANALEDIRCIFDIHGELYVELSAFLEIHLLFFDLDFEWDFAKITLLTFDLTCPQPVLADVDATSGLLTLHMGPRAGDRVAGDTTDGNESFIVTHVSGDPGTADGETVEVSFNGIKQNYSGVKKISADGGSGSDTIDLRSASAPADSTLFVRGGSGNDTIYASKGGGIYHGDGGNDTITGALADETFTGVADTFYGDDGADTLTGNEGNDTLDGGDGSDLIYGNAGNDTLTGGGGNDKLYGDVGTDTLRGGDGADLLEGQDDNDLVYGDAGDDTINGGAGDDQLIGGSDDDLMDGGSGNDIVLGDDGTIASPVFPSATSFPVHVTGISGSGNDVLAGGAGADAIFGAGGNDKLFGGTLLTSGVVTVTEFDSTDFLDGGDGNDILFADDAHGAESTTFPGSTIGGFAWLDTLDEHGVPNNVRDSIETGLASVTVELHKSDASLVATTTTDANGEFLFLGLAAGDYYVRFVAPTGLTFATQNAGADDTVDSDANASTGQTDVIQVDSGESNTTLAAGFHGTTPLLSIDNPSIEEGNTGAVDLVFTVSLSNPASQQVTVCYKSASGLGPDGADRFFDFSSVDWTLVFEPGETTKTIAVPIKGDLIDEGDAETFTVRLATPKNAALDPAHTVGIGTIIDDDDAPVIRVDDSVQDATPVHETTPLSFVLHLSNPSKFPIQLKYQTSQVVNADGTLAFDAAVVGVDYENTFELSPGSLTINPGETEKTIIIHPFGDTLNEYDERMALTVTLNPITPPNHASISDGAAIGTIDDDDPLPFARITPLVQSVTEGHAGLKDVPLTISLADEFGNPVISGRDVTVTWNTGRGTALVFGNASDPADAAYLFDRVTFTPGQSSKPITAQIIGDTRTEGPEYFFVNLLSAVNGRIDVDADNLNHAKVNIIDDESGDPGPWYVQFSSAAYSVDEGAGLATITLVRAADSSQPLAVYWTASGTATAGIDYIGVWENRTSGPRGLVDFAAGETTKTFTIPILEDNLYEGNETVILSLANPTGGQVRAPVATAVLTIIDNDGAPQIEISDATNVFDPDAPSGVQEGPGVVTLNFNVKVTGQTDLPVTVDWAAYNGTAVTPGDFVATGGPLNFGSVHGTETIPVSVTIIDDGAIEETESVYARLTNAGNATISDYEGIGDIFDNDTATVSGFVFLDSNANGFFDSSTEYGLANVSITITDVAGDHTATTDATGHYSASVLLGEDTIAVDETTVPAGSEVSTSAGNPFNYEFTLTTLAAPDIGFAIPPTEDVAPESIGEGGGANNDTAYGGTGNDTIDGGGGDDWLVGGHWLGPGCACTGAPYDATLQQQSSTDGGRIYIDPLTLPAPSSISGVVWNEALPADGIRPAGAPGLKNVQINLLDANFSLIATTYTAADGSYLFDKLVSATDPCVYYVQFLPPAGYKFAPQNVGSDSTDSDADLRTGLTAGITVHPSNNIQNVDAGMVAAPPGSAGPWSVQFTSIVYSVRETDGFASVTVYPTPASFHPIAVFFTKDGAVRPATAGLDYLGSKATFRFGLAEDLKTVVIPVLTDSNDTEGYETVDLFLRNPTGGQVTGNIPTAVLLIFDSPCPDDDIMHGSDGNDILLGDFGYFSAGAAVLLGGMGNDQLYGDDGADTLDGEGGNDVLEGAADNDTLNGGSENDTYVFNGDENLGSDTIVEVTSPFGGNDTIDFSATAGWAVTLDLSSTAVQNVTPSATLTLPAGNVIENLTGGRRNDTLTGNTLDNIIRGLAGNDLITGGAGDDTLEGGAGDDTYLFDSDSPLGHDDITEIAGGGIDTFDFSATTTQSINLDLSSPISQAVSSNLSITLSSSSGIEHVFGGQLGDTILGNSLDNRIQGNAGNDQLDGGAGDDTLLEERGGNFQLTDGPPLTLTLNGTETDMLANFENVSLAGDDSPNTLDASSFSGHVQLDGRGGDDTLIGGSGANFLTGGAGNDSIDGSRGNDTLVEQRDADFKLTDASLEIGAETDHFIGTIEKAILTGGDGNNILDASAFSGTVQLDGGAGDDTLTGTSNNDLLIGGANDDTLSGRSGNDTYQFDADDALGSDTINEVAGEGTDTLDFSLTQIAGVTVDLSLTSAQTVNSNLKLTLSAGNTIENVKGSQSDDVITGNGLVNQLEGNAGNDTLSGSKGDDTIDGGGGINPATGQPWIDRVLEQRDASMTLTPGALVIDGTETDTLVGIETATLIGGPSDNLLDASAFFRSVTLDGGKGNDTLRGSFGDDSLTGGPGDDTLQGSFGNDSYLFDADVALGTDTLIEPLFFGGIDTLDFSETTSIGTRVDLALTAVQAINANLSLSLNNAAVFENATGGSQNDTLLGNARDNVLTGNAGNDSIEGRAGNDTLMGNDGDDTYVFDADGPLGSDQLFEDVGTGGTDTLDFSATTTVGVSVNLGNAAPQTINANLTLELSTCHSVENVIGSSRDDVLTGNSAGNQITGGPGNDTLTGGMGDDTYVFDADSGLGSDTVTEEFLEGGNDTLDFSATSALAIAVNLSSPFAQAVNANLTVQLSGSAVIENVVGGARSDNLIGNSQANRIDGGAGDDTINAGAGDDELIGGIGNDTLTGGAGNDSYVFSDNWGVDTIVEAPSGGEDAVDFSEVTASLTFQAQANLAVTAGANSVTHAGVAVENLIGGSGSDVFNVIPSAQTAFTLSGNSGVLDVLNVDAQGFVVAQTSTTIATTGHEVVTYSGFEEVHVTNAG